ncbi:hypothetical protein HALLA_03265 (plasmid) [Halostagnicola larsenii XH-48]|uniref:Uncharacterized protein n=1 Tax=Halostagnicola larsenii XH-48 TaxID=797299 RepID=W0JW02_9EURY|nr:hypothetical protein HALLA_03265 [Halostagnicola larsenii XH-48]
MGLVGYVSASRRIGFCGFEAIDPIDSALETAWTGTVRSG